MMEERGSMHTRRLEGGATRPQPRPRRLALSAFGSILLLVLLLCLSPSSVHGMIDHDHIHCSSSDNFFQAWGFEFAVGGSYELQLQLEPGGWLAHNNSVQILLATDTQLEPIRSATMGDVCANMPFNYAEVLWQTTLGPGHTSTSMSIASMASKDWVRLLVLNCAEDSFDVAYSDVAMNPGGEYLSLSEVPYKSLFAIFVWVWAACVAAWSMHLFLYRRWNVRMQVCMALLPLSKTVLCVPSMLYWRWASSRGVYPLNLGWVVLACSVLDRVAWFGILYLLASGWRITKATLSPMERRGFMYFLVVIMVSFFVYEVWGGFLVFLLLFCYVLALRVIFSALVDNGNQLLRQMHVLSRAEIDYTRTPLAHKINIFKLLQVYMVAFISIDVIFHLWAAIFLRNSPWVSDAMEHGLSALLCLALAATFGLRPFNPFWLSIFASIMQSQQMEGAGVGGGVGAGAGAGGASPSPPAAALLQQIEGNEAAPRVGDPRRNGGASNDGGDEYHSLAEPHAQASSPVLTASSPSSFPSPSASSSSAFPADQLWRPGVPVPSASSCLPQGAAAAGWVAMVVAAAGGAGQGRRGRAGRAPPQPPVLVLECPLSDEQPIMIGTLVADPTVATSSSSAVAAAVGGAGGAVELPVWSALPAEALPYLPVNIRQQLQSQERMLQMDSRRQGGGSGVGASSSIGAVHGEAHRSSSTVARYQRVDTFPEYI